MSYFSEGVGLLAAADAYWLGRGKDRPQLTKAEALEALAVVVRPVTEGAGEYELDDNTDEFPDSSLGRLVAVAFDATPEEMVVVEDDEEGSLAEAWEKGPMRRFKKHFKIR